MPIVPSGRISWQRLASSQTALNQRHRGVTKTGTPGCRVVRMPPTQTGRATVYPAWPCDCMHRA
jgi:hypothetical protein